MSSELNKLFCAILSAILVYLFASFISELLYHVEPTKKLSLSYYTDTIESPSNIQITNDEPSKSFEISEESLVILIENANSEKGETFIKKNCASCHDFNMPIKNKIGPSLANIFDRKIGSISDYKYSKVLTNMNESWNLSNLYLFLESPKILSTIF